MDILTKDERRSVEVVAQSIDLATREYFARGARIERALRIAMVYLGLATWRKRDRARLEIVESARRGEVDLLTTQTVEIRCDGVRVWSFQISAKGLRIEFGAERWHGRLVRLNEYAVELAEL